MNMPTIIAAVSTGVCILRQYLSIKKETDANHH